MSERCTTFCDLLREQQTPRESYLCLQNSSPRAVCHQMRLAIKKRLMLIHSTEDNVSRNATGREEILKIGKRDFGPGSQGREGELKAWLGETHKHLIGR